ncbi:MAG: flippase [Sphaerochaetaceae bacterium]|nr:flippase [Sphaerochaetaceae bacterium]
MSNLKKILPKFILSKVENRPILQKILKNISWLTFERGLELIVALTVGIWVARYLGPDDFGLMNFAIAFTALFSPFISLGLDTVLHRELVANPKKSYSLLGTVFRIKLALSIVVGLMMLLVIFLIKPGDLLLFSMVGVFALGNVFNSLGGIGTYFDSRIESKNVVKSYSIALIISNILKIFFIIFNFSVFFFVIASLVNTILTISILIYYYFKEKQAILKWVFDFELAKNLLKMSWPLLFSALFAVIYLKIDQVMIGIMLSEYEVGIYSVAVKISEIGYFLPGAIALSLFPALMNSKKISNEKYFSRLQKMFDLFTWLPLIIILPIFFFSGFIINFLYGSEYSSAGIVLSILIWALLAIFVQSAVNNFINSEKLFKITLYSSLIGAVINIVANLILIPIYGIVGAAIATIISYFFVAYLSNLIFKKTRKLFIMQLKSFNLIRIINEINYENYPKKGSF